MNRIILFLWLSVYSIQLYSQNIILEKPRVDERIELLSIVFRLAGAEEYSSTFFKRYTDRIEQHFLPYKEHEIIKFVQELRRTNGVSYDAVMSMAIHLNSHLNPVVPLNDTIPDMRWGKENAKKFVRLLKKFYRESNCKEFFKANEELYNQTSESFYPVYKELDLHWYKSFYGKEPDEKFIIINAPGNGGGNYGPSITLKNGKREVYAIMGTWNTGKDGNAVFSFDGFFSTLLHEFNHSFINYLVDKNINTFQQSGDKIYTVVSDQMQRQAYGNWTTVIKESLVRSAVIKYMQDHGFEQDKIDKEIMSQLLRGFLWIKDLVGELNEYSSAREIYPTLESYMPNIAEAFEIYAENIETYKNEFESKQAKVVSISEFQNGDKNVSPEIKTITINFDRPLSDI